MSVHLSTLGASLMFVTTVALLGPSLASAQIARCPDGHGGIIFKNEPCDGTRETPASQLSESPRRLQQRSSQTAWTLVREKDAMTDQIVCLIESPHMLGRYRGDFVFASIRVLHTTTYGNLVAFYSRSTGVVGEAQSFHTNINGLGLRVDNLPFFSVDLRSDSRILGFHPEKSKDIIEQFLHGTSTKIRVRFWPYDDTVDMGEILLAGFPQALAELQRCAATGS